MFDRIRERLGLGAEPRANEHLEHVVALDLGQVTQVSGLALVETTDGGKTVNVRQLRRYQPGQPYPEIARDVEALLARPPVAIGEEERRYRPRPRLVVGVTAVGMNVGQLFSTSSAEVRYVAITAGDSEGFANGAARVPKRELVGALQRALQEKRLVISKKLPDAGALVDELQGYTTRIRLGSEGEDWRRESGRLDDLVLALALGYWVVHRRGPEFELFTLDGEDEQGWTRLV